MEEKESAEMETLKFALQGMTKLDRSKFVKTLRMPYLKVPAQSVGKIVGLPSILNNTIKKEEGLKPIMDFADNKHEKLVLFSRDKLRQNGEETTRSKIVTELKAVIGDAAPSEFGTLEKEVTYEKWSIASCIKAVLPPGLEFKGFSQIGHIAHLNLKEEILPYRFVIGELIHDKLPNVKTVVNKTDKINNEFRVFDMELLAGEPKYETESAENGLRYKMDFSKVFWNPRLSNIHERIVKKFDKDSVVFDITSGIGPFVLPAVKQRNILKAYANDLNPLSIDYLKENIKLNKINVDKVETFVMDATDFIRDVIPEQYSKVAEGDEKELKCDNEISGRNFHAIMNLPALSLTFLPNFRGLLRHHSKLRTYFQSHPFWIHCHFFVKASADEEDKWFRNKAECFVRDIVNIPDMIIQDVHYLRIVAPRKQMYCVSFQLPDEYAFSTESDESLNETEINNKRKLLDDAESNELPKMLRSPSRLLSQYMGRSIVKEVESRNASTISLHGIARKHVEKSVNRYTNDRVNWLGPDLACLEWLMNCGATSVKMSNGEIIRSSQEMRKFIAGLGFQLSGRVKASKVPHTEVVKKFAVTTGEGFSVDEDANYDEAWKHLPPVYIDEVDASDSVIADPGFLYFTQCRQIKVMKLNYCDYFGDLAIRELALGRPSMTVTNLEIIGNFLMTEASIYWLSKMHALKRLHFYSLSFTAERQTILRQCRLAMPKCEVSFPAVNPKGLGYENVSNPMAKLMASLSGGVSDALGGSPGESGMPGMPQGMGMPPGRGMHSFMGMPPGMGMGMPPGMGMGMPPGMGMSMPPGMGMGGPHGHSFAHNGESSGSDSSSQEGPPSGGMPGPVMALLASMFGSHGQGGGGQRGGLFGGGGQGGGLFASGGPFGGGGQGGGLPNLASLFQGGHHGGPGGSGQGGGLFGSGSQGGGLFGGGSQGGGLFGSGSQGGGLFGSGSQGGGLFGGGGQGGGLPNLAALFQGGHHGSPGGGGQSSFGQGFPGMSQNGAGMFGGLFHHGSGSGSGGPGSGGFGGGSGGQFPNPFAGPVMS